MMSELSEWLGCSMSLSLCVYHTLQGSLTRVHCLYSSRVLSFQTKAAIPLMIIILALCTLRLIFIDGRDGFEQGPCRGVIETCFLRSGQRCCHLLNVEQRKQQATLDERDAVETLEGRSGIAGKRDRRCFVRLPRRRASMQDIFDLSIEPTGKLPSWYCLPMSAC